MPKVTLPVSHGVGIHVGHWMPDPVLLTSKLYSFLVLSFNVLGKACVDRHGEMWGKTKVAKYPQKKMQWWGTWSEVAGAMDV